MAGIIRTLGALNALLSNAPDAEAQDATLAGELLIQGGKGLKESKQL